MRQPWTVGAATTCLLLLVSACTGLASATKSTIREGAESWAMPQGFSAATIAAGQFGLFALLRQTSASSSLAVYIEGDGAGWPSVFTPPHDPTPRFSVALRLADRDPSAAVAYLGRPCHYLTDDERERCSSSYWSERRFSDEVLVGMGAAVDHLKRLSGARFVRLVGYSGGGVVATLLAMERDDVTELITISAPLALSEWVTVNKLTPLDGSRNPMNLPQFPVMLSATHFSGGRDDVVPSSIVKHFVDTHGGRLVVMNEYDHQCCWIEAWPTLLQRAGSASPLQ
jgi:hypothetical protein